jgi:hypothetical protein
MLRGLCEEWDATLPTPYVFPRASTLSFFCGSVLARTAVQQILYRGRLAVEATIRRFALLMGIATFLQTRDSRTSWVSDDGNSSDSAMHRR